MVTGDIFVEATITMHLLPPSLIVIVLLLMHLLIIPLLVEVEIKASTKRYLVTGGGRNVDLSLYYTFVGEGWRNYTDDDNSSVIGGIWNIVNDIYVCISEGCRNKAIGDSASMSSWSKKSINSNHSRLITVSTAILSGGNSKLSSLTSSSSSFSSGGVGTIVEG